MTEIERLRADIEVVRLIQIGLLATLGTMDAEILRVALQHTLSCHDASSPYSVSWTDEQLDYVQERLAATFSGLPRP